MIPLEVVFEVPPEIARGLASGALERIGGVIRETGSKQVVMWLREGARIVDNPNLAAGVLRSLINVGSGGLLDVAVSANRHQQVLQQLRVIQGISSVGAAASVLGIPVQIATTIYLAKLISKLQQDIIAEFERDRSVKLESAMEYVHKVVSKLEGARKASAVDRIAPDLLEARNHLKEDFDKLLCEKQVSVENTELAIRLLQQQMQVDTANVRIHLQSGDQNAAYEILENGLVEYRKQACRLIQQLLGKRARYFHSQVNDADFLRFVAVEEWLRNERDILYDLVIDNREDFWSRRIGKAIGPNKPDRVRKFTYVGHLESLDYAASIIESHQRMEGYKLELKAIERLGITFSDWEMRISDRLSDEGIDLAGSHDHKYAALVDKTWLDEQQAPHAV